MNQPPKITDRVLWVAVPRESRDDKDALKIDPTKFSQGDIVAGVKVSE